MKEQYLFGVLSHIRQHAAELSNTRAYSIGFVLSLFRTYSGKYACII